MNAGRGYSAITAEGFRKVVEGDERFQLREPQLAYNDHFIDKNGPLSIENGVIWEK
jgi:hypothetical protein